MTTVKFCIIRLKELEELVEHSELATNKRTTAVCWHSQAVRVHVFWSVSGIA